MATCAVDRCNTPAADDSLYCPYHLEDQFRLRRDLDRRPSLSTGRSADYAQNGDAGAGSGVLIGVAAGLTLLGFVVGFIICAQVSP